MIEWIMIVVFAGGYAIATVEFSSQESCEKARVEIKRGIDRRLHTLCVKK